MRNTKLVAIIICIVFCFSLASCGNTYSGTYIATYDLTDVFAEMLCADRSDVEYEGVVEAKYTLTLEKGKYRIELDSESLKESAEAYLNNNFDLAFESLLSKNGIVFMVGTNMKGNYELTAGQMGYSSYEELKSAAIDMYLEQLTTLFPETIDTGSYKIDDYRIIFISDNGTEYEEVLANDSTVIVKFEDMTSLTGSQIVFDVNDAYDSFTVKYDDNPMLQGENLKLVFKMQA